MKTAQKRNLCGMCGICAVSLCGIKSLILKGCAVCAVSRLTWVGGRVCLRAHMRTRTRAGIPHIPHIPHTLYESSTCTSSHTAHDTPHTAHLKKMDAKTTSTHTRVIPCTKDNAPQMQKVVKAWPELHALVQDLQAQDLFPGLRAMQITLTGSAAFTAKGLDAVNEINATKAV